MRPGTEAGLLDAIRRHTLAKEAYDAARAEHDEARKALVAVLHEQGVIGFSL